MTAKYVNGKLQFIDRAPNETFNSGSGLEFSIVDSPSHKDANSIIARNDKPKDEIRYIDTRTGKPAHNIRFDLVDVFTTVDDNHQHGLKAELYNGALMIDDRGATTSDGVFHYHSYIRQGDTFESSEEYNHKHLASIDPIRDRFEAALRKDHPYIVRAGSKPQDRNGDNPMSNVNTTEKEVNRLKAIVALKPDQRAVFDDLSEKEQNDFCDLPIEARQKILDTQFKEEIDKRAEADKSKEVDRSTEDYMTDHDGSKVYRTDNPNRYADLKEIQELRKSQAASEERATAADFVARGAKAFPNLGGSDEVKGVLLRMVETKSVPSISDATAKELRNTLDQANVAIRKLTNETGRSIHDISEGIDADEGEKLDRDAAYAKATELAQEEVDRSDGKLTIEQARTKVVNKPENRAIKEALQ